jgi:predicted ATP-grasp superfamily ATP-dependent carboligase
VPRASAPNRSWPVAEGAGLLLAGASVRALALSACGGRLARRLFPGGIQALDYFGDWDLLRLPVHGVSLRRDLGRPRTVAALLRAALELPWTCVAYAGGVENRPTLLEAVERLARERGGLVLGNGAGAVRAVRDPATFFGFLRRAGIPHADTRSPTEAAPRRPGGFWKPRRSGGGGGLRPAAPGEPRPRGFFFQERLRGTPASVGFLADGRRALLLGASRQIVGFRRLGGRGYRYGGSIAGPAAAILGGENLAILAEAATSITARFGLRGLNGLDVILTPDGRARVIEINPRYTASMELLEALAGRNLFDLHLRAVRGSLPVRGNLPVRESRGAVAGRRPPREAPPSGAPPPAGVFLAKGILYAGRALVGARPEALAALGCRDIPVPGEPIGEGEPVLTVFATGATPEACRDELGRRADEARRLLATRAAAAAACAKMPAKRAIHRQSERRSAPGRAGGMIRDGNF